MTANNPAPAPLPSARRPARLRLAGVLVLVLGLAVAGVVYWHGTHTPDVMDDLSLQGFNRARDRQMGMLYGKMGLLTENLIDDLKQPENQAEIIAAISILSAAGCFYFARLLGPDEKRR